MSKDELTLQIKGEYFDLVLNGVKKQEFRDVYPGNYQKYVTMVPVNGKKKLEVINYKRLQLINGMKKDSRKLTVEVLKTEMEFEWDENEKILTQDHPVLGRFPVGMVIIFTLGNILSTQNV